MPASERAKNVALGVSVLAWALLGLLRSAPLDRWTAPRVTIAALNLCIGSLFLRRAGVLEPPRALGLLAALPSMLLAGAALKAAPPPHEWPIHASIPFVAGGALAVHALATLGKCFAVLPSVRGVVIDGPYRFVRHPAYAAELAMIVACGLARSPAVAALLGLAGFGLLAMRLGVEEEMLGRLPDYRAYRERVRWRLVPGVW